MTEYMIEYTTSTRRARLRRIRRLIALGLYQTQDKIEATAKRMLPDVAEARDPQKARIK